MDQNRDWKLIAALVLAGLALFIALGGQRGYGNDQVSTVPQQIIVQPVAPSTGTTAPVITLPGAQPYAAHAWGGGGHMFPLFPLLFFAGLIFLAFRVFGHRRNGWGGPSWYGRQWGGPDPGPGPQAPPYGQYAPPYPPQGQGQGQNQPYGGYPQGQQPQQGHQGAPGQQGQPTQAMDTQGDITRPEGSGD